MDSGIQSKSETAQSVAREPKNFVSVFFAAWSKSSANFAFSQTQLVEVVTWQVWYAQEDMN